jgi:hypothetical protein
LSINDNVRQTSGRLQTAALVLEKNIFGLKKNKFYYLLQADYGILINYHPPRLKPENKNSDNRSYLVGIIVL